jgi:exosortase
MNFTATTTAAAEAAHSNSRWKMWLGCLGILLLILYAPILKSLAESWWTDADYGHGFLVPLFAAYVPWCGRGRLFGIPMLPSNFGLLVMVGATGLLLVGSLGAELFTSRFSIIALIAGMVLFLAGWRMLRAVSFPLAFLVLMIPIPVIIYNQITFPLQLIASRFAASWLQLIQVPVLREGNLLILPNYTLEVIEACSGIRSLMTLLTLVIAYGYFAEKRRWARCALVLLVPPVAIVSNSIRIVGFGILTYRFGPRAAEGFFHVFSGWVIFFAALILMFLAHSAIRLIPWDRGEKSYV